MPVRTQSCEMVALIDDSGEAHDGLLVLTRRDGRRSHWVLHVKSGWPSGGILTLGRRREMRDEATGGRARSYGAGADTYVLCGVLGGLWSSWEAAARPLEIC